jgi:tetratricopeptide (TPR) repeat protein
MIMFRGLLTCFKSACYASIVLCLLTTVVVAEEAPLPAQAKAEFEGAYKAALESVAKEDWEGAEVLLEAALKSLGNQPHPDRVTAEGILAKAKRTNAQRREAATLLQTAQEMLKQQKWAEAEALLQKAKDRGADPQIVDAALAAAKAGQGKEAYKTFLAEGMACSGREDWAGAERAFVKALEVKPDDPAATNGLKEARAKRAAGTTTTTAPATPVAVPVTPTTPVVSTPAAPVLDVRKPMELPDPVALDRDEWERGAGSSCYWAAELLHLEEGDEKFRLPLTGDFAAQIAIEAQMDHRSMIYLDLRPEKKKAAPVIRGYGSKEGSAPYLQVGKDVAGRGSAQPANKRIVLGFRRTGQQIEFFCDGQKIGETFAVPADAALWFWVCGKGYIYAGKVVRK